MREKERERERKRAKERERVREINHLSVHQWIRSAIRESQQPTSPIGFLFLKLPPPPCAVLLVQCNVMYVCMNVCLYACMYVSM